MDVFGVLPEKYCLYFKVLEVISFIAMLLVIVFFIMSMFSKDKKVLFYLASTAVAYFIMYFQSRLLHSMCVLTLK